MTSYSPTMKAYLKRGNQMINLCVLSDHYVIASDSATFSAGEAELISVIDNRVYEHLIHLTTGMTPHNPKAEFDRLEYLPF